MGVSSTSNRVGLVGDGSTTTFSFPYYFFAQADLVVYLYDTVTGSATLKVLNTHYTITGSVNAQGVYQSGGSVAFVAAPTSTQVVVIFRSPAQTQTFSLGQNGLISSSALVQQLDYLTLLAQRLEDQVTRAVQIPDGLGATFSAALPSTIALAANQGATLVVNASGNGFDLGPTASAVSGATASATAAAASASAASGSASSASTSATGAASSATSAATSAAAAAAAAGTAAANSIKGNNTGSPATAIDLTVTQVRTMLGDITGLTGDVTATGTGGSAAATIANSAVTNAKMANMVTATIKGNNSGSTGAPLDLTVTQVTAMLNAMVGDSGSGGTKGLVSAPAAGDALAGKFWKADGSWAAPASLSLTAPTLTKFLSTGTATGYMFTITAGSATVGATYTNNGNTYTVLNTIAAGTQLFTSQALAPLTSGTLTKASGTGDATITFSANVALATYTRPTSPTPLYLKIKMVGGGGGGAGSAGGGVGGQGGTGGTTFFGANLMAANGGTGGQANGSTNPGGTGGTASLGTGPIGIALTGGGGGGGGQYISTAYTGGGIGGSSAFGGASASNASLGGAGAANTGGGGSGASTAGATLAGGGGGSGGYVEAIINSPGASYPIVVAAGGAAGLNGTGGNTGGAGATGLIMIEEHYQ